MNGLSDIACNEDVVFKNMKLLLNVANKKVLEVGGSYPKEKLLNTSIKKWVSVDPLNSCLYANDNFYASYATNILDFRTDEKFDIVFSSNTFHYLPKFAETMEYFYQLLDEGGHVFSHYGPIWSSPDGHNFENIRLSRNQILNFWENNILPKWFHILYDEHQLADMINQHFSSEDTQVIINYLFKSNYINRLFFKDYIQIFIDTGFKIKLLSTSSVLDYDLKPIIKCSLSDKEIKSKLSNIYGNDDYDSRDIMVLLEK